MPPQSNNRMAYLSFLTGVVVLLIVGIVLFPRYIRPEQPAFQAVTTTIPVLHQFKKLVHTYVGEVQVPTPCHTISGDAVVQESFPEQVAIRLETKEGAASCAQVVTVKKFKVTFQASEQAVVRAYLNSTPVLFKISEAPASVDLQATGV